MTSTAPRLCELCGGPIEPSSGPGRPRKFCETCSPPGDPRGATRAWKAAEERRGGLTAAQLGRLWRATPAEALLVLGVLRDLGYVRRDGRRWLEVPPFRFEGLRCSS